MSLKDPMMKTAFVALVSAGLLAGCAGIDASNNTAQMPNNPQGGPLLNEGQAIALAGFALKSPANTAGNPELAARAIAAEDWLAGQTLLTGQYADYQPAGQLQWQRFRGEARAAIGVSPTAPSQVVVSQLFATADALHAGNREAALAALNNPVFTLGPQATLTALTNLPPLPDRDWAFADLRRNDNREYGPGTFGGVRN